MSKKVLLTLKTANKFHMMSNGLSYAKTMKVSGVLCKPYQLSFMILLFILIYGQLHIVLYFVIYIVIIHHAEVMIVLFSSGNLANAVKAEVIIKRPVEHKGYVNKIFTNSCYICNPCLH